MEKKVKKKFQTTEVYAAKEENPVLTQAIVSTNESIASVKSRIESLDARLDALVDNLTRGRRIKKDM